jgi:TetR/AcrR family transcriptional regulator, transcriptional repressor for nem operon
MPRPKQFDRADALRAGMRVFWRQGYAATTTDDLARAMGIGRQSFYDTFGDKRRCYLEALRDYTREQVGGQVEAMRRGASPLATLRTILRAAAERPDDERVLGCMVVNALAEFGGADAGVTATLAPGAVLIEETVRQLLREAKARGEMRPELDEADAARALLCARSGLMLHAKAGWSRDALRRAADFAVDGLRASAD